MLKSKSGFPLTLISLFLCACGTPPRPNSTVATAHSTPVVSGTATPKQVTSLMDAAEQHGKVLSLQGPTYRLTRLERGDFSGDGEDDAIVLYSIDSFGVNAVFVEMHAFRREGPRVRHVGQLKNRGLIDWETFRIEPGRVSYEATTLRPGDARCCPSGREHISFTIR